MADDFGAAGILPHIFPNGELLLVLQHIEHAVRVQDGKVTFAVEQRQVQGVDGQFIRQRVDFFQNVGFYNFGPFKGQELAIIQAGKFQVASRAVAGRKCQNDAAVVLHLAGAVIIDRVRGEYSGRQQASIGAIPLDGQFTGPILGRRIEMQHQTAAAVGLREADLQHRRRGKVAAFIGKLAAPQSPKLPGWTIREKREAAIHQELPGLQGAI